MASIDPRESGFSRPVRPSAVNPEPSIRQRLVPHWRLVLIGAAALAAALWLIFERTAS